MHLSRHGQVWEISLLVRLAVISLAAAGDVRLSQFTLIAKQIRASTFQYSANIIR